MTLLLGSGLPDTPLVWCAGKSVSRQAYINAVHSYLDNHPAGGSILNLCAGRLRFMVALAAAGLRGQEVLLPHSSSATAIAAAGSGNSNHVDDQTLSLTMSAGSDRMPGIAVPEAATACVLYTSGTTGGPQPHRKSWAVLAATARLDAGRLLGNVPVNIVATIPSQHMYGLQTAVLLPLFAGCAVHDGRPFYPADIATALAEVPAPRMLATTPLHLRTCVESGIPLPPLERVVSATAPLPLELAQRAETQWQAPVWEIYGSTEAGTIGTRRPTANERWQLLPGARLDGNPENCTFHAAHLPASLALSDRIEQLPDNCFRLLGRDSDLVKVAGKRASLTELNVQLLSVPGVIDGVIFQPDGSERTAALVVAPELDATSLRRLLARTVDAAFLPRQVVLLPQLPRDALGKLARHALHLALRL